MTDDWTIEIARIRADTIEEELGDGRRPYMVIMHMIRSKLDANRLIEEGAQSDPVAMAAWHAYHEFIELAREEVGRGILYDVHRQVQRVLFVYNMHSQR